MLKEAIPFDLYATGAIDLQAAASARIADGRYSLRKLLGRGALGVVWLAYDESLKTEVALKFLPPQIGWDVVALDELRREAARAQQLDHPNIVRIHELHEATGEAAFIAMEYVDGPNLTTLRLQQSGRVMPWVMLEPLVPQLCQALQYAHSQGTIHRDLKPPNLMVDQTGRLKLADFGVSRALADALSRTGDASASGSLLYMSPQQLDGALPKAADDVYSLGATLYELLTSKPPFYSGDISYQARHRSAQPLEDRLRELQLANPIPAHVEDLVLACLAKRGS